MINHLLQTHCRQVDSWTQHRGMQGYSWRLSSPDWLYVSILGHFTSLPWETVLGKTNTLLSWPCTKSQDHLMCLMRWFECGLPYCKKLCPQPVFRGIALLKGAEMLELPHLMKHSSPCLRSDLRAWVRSMGAFPTYFSRVKPWHWEVRQTWAGGAGAKLSLAGWPEVSKPSWL